MKSSFSMSWEEKAFAKDSGGSVSVIMSTWPPRSYRCSFCRRDFKSAQALGGHMNIHRRDRARLKQTLIYNDHLNYSHDIHHHQPSFNSLSSDYVNSAALCRQKKVRFDEYPFLSKIEYLKEINPRVETDLSLVVSQNRSSGSNEGSCKRAKTTSSCNLAALTLVFNPNCHILQSSDDLDLELRLGVDPPELLQ